MVTRRGILKEKVKGRSKSIEEAKRVQSIREEQEKWENDNPDLFDARILLGLTFSKFIRRMQGIDVETDQSIESCVEKITRSIVIPYKEKKYGRCDIIKESIEYWLHTKHMRGEMTLLEVGSFVREPVDVSLTFNNEEHDLIPWSPNHFMGNMMWKDMFTISGILNSNTIKNKARFDLFSKFSDPFIYSETMLSLVIRGAEIHPAFDINPGQQLEFEV